MKDEYSKETLALGQQIQEYASMDPYSSERPKVVQVRTECIFSISTSEWIPGPKYSTRAAHIEGST